MALTLFAPRIHLDLYGLLFITIVNSNKCFILERSFCFCVITVVTCAITCWIFLSISIIHLTVQHNVSFLGSFMPKGCGYGIKVTLTTIFVPFFQISEHPISSIPLLAHEKNLHEQNVCAF